MLGSIGLTLRVQGTTIKFTREITWQRFIPVYTGNTKTQYDRPKCTPVYPCVYREHSDVFLLPPLGRGLSLCVQGTLSILPRCYLGDRFIPVHTGNTLIITYCFIIKILTVKFLPPFLNVFVIKKVAVYLRSFRILY